jgi:hypothetical protein
MEAAARGHAVVEKTSHVLWDREELAEACRVGCYPDPDQVAPPDGQVAVSGPFPGCLQQFAAPADLGDYRLVGQTEHFLIFAPPRPGPPAARRSPNILP